jgi:hypothetical protein
MYGLAVANGFCTNGFELLYANCEYNKLWIGLDVALGLNALATFDAKAEVFVGID